MEQIAFKPYACGTMTQPFVDCAIELAQQHVPADDITAIVCEVGEGTVHRRYSINPHDDYPRNFTGHLRATLRDGSTREIRRPYLRGGVHAPLSRAELEAKFMDNVLYGGWRREQGERFTQIARDLVAQPTLAAMTALRA